MGEKRYNFEVAEMTEEEVRFYNALDIKNAYWGTRLIAIGDWVADREKKMYYTLNSCPGRLELEGINGPDYDNFIYKGIVNVIAYESHIDVMKRTIEYEIKAVIIDRRLENEQEDFIEAVVEALIVLKKERNYKCVFKEVPENVRYEDFNLAHWRYVNL